MTSCKQTGVETDMSRLPSAFCTLAAFHFVPLLCMQDKTRADDERSIERGVLSSPLIFGLKISNFPNSIWTFNEENEIINI